MSPGPVPVPPVVMMQVGAQGLVFQQAAQRLRVVVADAHPVRVRTGLRGSRGQRMRVGVHDLPGLAAPASVDELVAGRGHETIRGLGRTTTCPMPVAAKHGDQGRCHVRAGAGEQRAGLAVLRRHGEGRSPALGSVPGRSPPRPCPGRSTPAGTTTSAPAGSGAPAATEKHVPGVSRTGRQLAAPRSPTTLSRMAGPGRAGGGRDVAGPRPSECPPSVRRSRPSAAWSKAGNAVRGDDVLGEHVAVRLSEVEVERRQRDATAQDTCPGSRRAASTRSWPPASVFAVILLNPQSALGCSGLVQVVADVVPSQSRNAATEVRRARRRSAPPSVGSRAASRCRSGCPGRRCACTGTPSVRSRSIASVSWISPPLPGLIRRIASKIGRRQHVAAEHGEVARGLPPVPASPPDR